MAEPSADDSIRAILLDIEGTTTPVDFVYRTLFPYARPRLKQFLLENGNDPAVRKDIEALRKHHRADAANLSGPPKWLDETPELELASAAIYAGWLMDRDSKCTALKSLQGKIWNEGYKNADLHGEVYPDVPVAMARWSRQGKIVCIYSSGSKLAQKLLFGSSAHGDLKGLIRDYFDTTIGPKTAPQSYSKIAKELSLEASNILFISDVSKELDAAQEAGMRTALCVREKSSGPDASSHRVIHSFDEILSTH